MDKNIALVLAVKHLHKTTPPPDLQNAYFILVEITKDMVKLVAKKISGSSGPGGAYSEYLRGFILKLGEDGKKLFTTVEILVNWLVNKILPWEAYLVFMPGRLIALDKQPGFRTVGVGETWRQLFAKYVLRVTGPKATNAC